MTKHAAAVFSAAQRELTEAKAALEHQLIRSAISGAYYAIFHAAQAALATRGSKPITHRGLASEFSRVFIKSGEVDQEFRQILARAADQRHVVDYGVAELDYLPSLETAREIVTSAKRFVAKMGKIIEAEN